MSHGILEGSREIWYSRRI